MNETKKVILEVEQLGGCSDKLLCKNICKIDSVVSARIIDPAQAVLDAEAIRRAFPLFDDEGLDENEHCCEWHLQHDRKRLHAMLGQREEEQ